MEKKYLLHKYLNGEASEDEIRELKRSPEYASYLKIADATRDLDTPLFNAEKNFEEISIGKKVASRRRSFIASPIFRIAAAFAVVIAGYLYLNSLNTTIRTGIAEKQDITLPDGSEVGLNANSMLRYRNKNWENNRMLKLDGEAFFDVKKGSSFEVDTELGLVEVLGTEFNVFSREHVFSIACYEGLVSAAFTDTIVQVPAGNKLVVESGKLMSLSAIDTDNPTWVAGESSFENTELYIIINELESQYRINITAPGSLGARRFSGSFTHTNLSMALQSVFEPLQLSYTVKGSEVTVYATKDP